MEFVLTFGSTHKVLKAESILEARGLDFTLDPAPKALSRYCALVITVEEGALAGVSRALEGEGAELKAVYKKEGEEYVEV